jgi:hypothetical protein
LTTSRSQVRTVGAKQRALVITNTTQRRADGDASGRREGPKRLIVDLFPPTQRDPYGIHKVIWDEIVEEDFTFPEGKDLILVSYKTGGERAAYIEPAAVGDALSDMPLFLTNDVHVMVPLESTYQATWDACPEDLRIAVETGVLPEPEAE